MTDNLTLEQIIKGLNQIENVAEWYLIGDDYSKIEWLSDGVKPTLSEVKNAYSIMESQKIATEKQLNDLKLSAKNKLIAGQPLTSEEANALIS